jgi:type II secretory pathway component GspD/PulD (secretin)
MIKRLLNIILILTTVFALAEAVPAEAKDVTKVISLRYRQASELLPTLQPFVNKGGIITAKNNHIIIRSSMSNVAEISDLIQQLDIPAQRLLIEVRQPLVGSREAEETNISGQIGSADGAQVTIESHRTGSRDNAVTSQRLQVLDGHSAVIKSGKLVPMAKRQIRKGKAETVIEHQDVSSGFSVTPRLTGEDSVTIEIAPFSSSLASGGGGVINQQQALTTLSGKLGEWIEVSGTSSRQQENVKTYSTQNRNEQQRRILIKVTKLD